jgi:hypothetical protein
MFGNEVMFITFQHPAAGLTQKNKCSVRLSALKDDDPQVPQASALLLLSTSSSRMKATASQELSQGSSCPHKLVNQARRIVFVEMDILTIVVKGRTNRRKRNKSKSPKNRRAAFLEATVKRSRRLKSNHSGNSPAGHHHHDESRRKGSKWV